MDKPITKKRTKKSEFDDFRVWLSRLGLTNPHLHINGISHPSAIMTVDFGTPLTEEKLEPEQSAELVLRMRNATRALLQDKDLVIRVQNDPLNGIWWASVG